MKSVIKFEKRGEHFVRFLVPGATLALRVADAYIRNSAKFDFEPYPDDKYEFVVRSESRQVLAKVRGLDISRWP